MNREPSKPGELSGLTKIEAEDLLDQLEAAGYDLCQLSFVDNQGFRVRANGAHEQVEIKLVATE